MSGFKIECLKCGKLIAFKEGVWWKPLADEKSGDVYAVRVQLECPCGNAVGYVDMLADGEGEEE